MVRLTWTLAVWMSLVGAVSASLAPRKESSPLGHGVPSAPAARFLAPAPDQTAGGANADYVLTDQTEVFLNGKPCKYAEIPAHARIVHMEVAADNKTVLKVHFRTGK
jgi:hypothetical protein